MLTIDEADVVTRAEEIGRQAVAGLLTRSAIDYLAPPVVISSSSCAG